jgi:hypothetical protein
MVKTRNWLFLLVVALLASGVTYLLTTRGVIISKGNSYVISNDPSEESPGGQAVGATLYKSISRAEAVNGMRQYFNLELPESAFVPGAVIHFPNYTFSATATPPVPLTNPNSEPGFVIFTFFDPNKTYRSNGLLYNILLQSPQQNSRRSKISLNCLATFSYCHGAMLCLGLLDVAKNDNGRKVEQWVKSDPIIDSRIGKSCADMFGRANKLTIFDDEIHKQ